MSRAPDLVSLPGVTTPPQAIGKRNHVNGDTVNGHNRAGSETMDADALNKALKDLKEAGNTRERTPGASPSRKRQRVYGDRSVTISYSLV